MKSHVLGQPDDDRADRRPPGCPSATMTTTRSTGAGISPLVIDGAEPPARQPGRRPGAEANEQEDARHVDAQGRQHVPVVVRRMIIPAWCA
jgi:hypothetical protein